MSFPRSQNRDRGHPVFRSADSQQIGFVDGDEGRPALDCGQQTVLFVVEGLRGVEHDEHQRGVGERFAAARDAELLDFFEIRTGSFAQTGGVDQLERNAVERDALGDEVARGAGSCGDDGAVALDEAIEERALAGVGPADDGERKAVVHDAAAGEGGFERGERRRELGDAPGDLRLRRDVEIVFGKVDAGFEQSDQFDEGLLSRARRGG